MGVKGLEFFLEVSCAGDACRKVDIKDLVTNYVQTTKKKPIVVVDGLAIMRYLHGNNNWICGGQLKEFFVEARRFVDSFQDLGVHLVFFIDGPTPEAKRETWISRRYKSMQDTFQILNLLSNGTHSSEIPEKYFMLPAGVSAIIRWVFQIGCGCEVHFAIKECDEEIAKYAHENRCFAIVSQDTDFLIYNAAEYYLSMKHLDLDTMTTMYYSSRRLAEKLGIDITQLPLLASLMGNDIINFQQLKGFHRHVVNRGPLDFKILVPAIAGYIRRYPVGDGLFQSLPDIAEYVFNDSRKAELLMCSIKSYSLNEDTKDNDSDCTRYHAEWNQILKEAKNRHRNGVNHGYVLTILFGFPFEQVTSLEDYANKSGIPPSAQILRPLRQRLYGILLHEKGLDGQDKHQVKEWCMEGRGTIDRYRVTDAIPPTMNYPGLLTLWQNHNDNVQDTKWKLFATSVSSNLDSGKLRSLPKFLVIPAAALFYLNEAEFDIKHWEINALLATAVVLEQYDSNQLSSLSVDPVNVRAVILATVYTRTVTALMWLLCVCGFPIEHKYVMPWLYFDGKLFQIKYKEASKSNSVSQLCEHQDSAQKMFEQVRLLI